MNEYNVIIQRFDDFENQINKHIIKDEEFQEKQIEQYVIQKEHYAKEEEQLGNISDTLLRHEKKLEEINGGLNNTKQLVAQQEIKISSHENRLDGFGSRIANNESSMSTHLGASEAKDRTETKYEARMSQGKVVLISCIGTFGTLFIAAIFYAKFFQ